MNEIWKDVEGYEGRYQISSCGRVKSLSRKMWNGKVWWQSEEKVLTNFKKSKGNDYVYVNLKKNNKGKKFYIHRLMARAFIDNPLNKKQVNHINGIKYDNRLDNLEWVTHQENVDHMWDKKLTTNYGETATNSKLSNKEVIRIFNLKDSDITQTELAKEYGVSIKTIGRIFKGERWGWLTGGLK